MHGHWTVKLLDPTASGPECVNLNFLVYWSNVTAIARVTSNTRSLVITTLCHLRLNSSRRRAGEVEVVVSQQHTVRKLRVWSLTTVAS